MWQHTEQLQELGGQEVPGAVSNPQSLAVGDNAPGAVQAGSVVVAVTHGLHVNGF
jgi:hypothetical protein